MKKPQRSGVKEKKKKFHPLQSADLGSGLSGFCFFPWCITTVINGLFSGALLHQQKNGGAAGSGQRIWRILKSKLHRTEAAVQKFQMQCLRTVPRIT